jgi:transcriptional regulator with XRE-family HTH domain
MEYSVKAFFMAPVYSTYEREKSVPRRKTHASTEERGIGERLTALRKARGITQVDLAERLGMSQPLLSKYERGELRMHGALVAQIAKLLGASSDQILGITSLKVEGPFRDRRFVQRLQKIDRLRKRERQMLLGTIDAFLKGTGAS